MLREIGPAEVLEIHREERDVVEDIEPAQPVVELHAVEHAGIVGQAENILGEQVPVSVDDQTLRCAFGQQRGPAVDEGQGQLGNPVMQ